VYSQSFDPVSTSIQDRVETVGEGVRLMFRVRLGLSYIYLITPL
jgi:hypothetical protein